MSIFGVKRGWVVDKDILSNATLKMDGKRIINVAYPRNPVENSAYNGDVVTAKALSDFRKYLHGEVLLRNSDNVMDGRLEMSGHKIKELGSPVDPGDAVNKGYITARISIMTGIIEDILERILINWKKIRRCVCNLVIGKTPDHTLCHKSWAHRQLILYCEKAQTQKCLGFGS